MKKALLILLISVLVVPAFAQSSDTAINWGWLYNTGKALADGLTNGYNGIGFDVYANHNNSKEQKLLTAYDLKKFDGLVDDGKYIQPAIGVITDITKHYGLHAGVNAVNEDKQNTPINIKLAGYGVADFDGNGYAGVFIAGKINIDKLFK